jgi:hypothetical protein
MDEISIRIISSLLRQVTWLVALTLNPFGVYRQVNH